MRVHAFSSSLRLTGIIALTDVLSKFVVTKAVKDNTAKTAVEFLTNDVILKYGTPT